MLEARVLPLKATAAVAVAPFRWIMSLAGRAPVGVTLPGPGRVVRRDGVTYLWAGPAAWLVMADEAGLEETLQGLAVTDQSDGRVILLVGGSQARDILAKLVPIDLDEAVFDEDATALTLAGHIPVQIWREGEAFALACFRSYAESLHHALVQAETGRG